jgi:hypothetical protein
VNAETGGIPGTKILVDDDDGKMEFHGGQGSGIRGRKVLAVEERQDFIRQFRE